MCERGIVFYMYENWDCVCVICESGDCVCVMCVRGSVCYV